MYQVKEEKSLVRFGDGEFGGKAEETLKELIDIINAEVLQRRDISEVTLYIGGYSLAGLFALWTAYQTDVFKGVAAASPSVWFPGIKEYIAQKDIKTSAVYLSLGDKESRTKNKTMARVGNSIQDIYIMLSAKVDAIFEWNEGNHFMDPDLRMAKAFTWVLTRN